VRFGDLPELKRRPSLTGRGKRRTRATPKILNPQISKLGGSWGGIFASRGPRGLGCKGSTFHFMEWSPTPSAALRLQTLNPKP